MYRAFELELPKDVFADYRSVGEAIHSAERAKIKAYLDDFNIEDGPLDGSSIQRLWFPTVEANVFLSHSHKDEKDVVALAGFLHKELGMKPFIDSSIWGCAAELLKKIDDKHCPILPERTSYDYLKRNDSTSHVHMMLSTALGMMIDATECAIFLNTPSSISAQEAIQGTTKSPWIYAELATIIIVRRRTTKSHRAGVQKTAQLRNFSEARLEVDYLAPRASLRKITEETLCQLKAARLRELIHQQPRSALDLLYEMVRE
jgi:hypothetical protein